MLPRNENGNLTDVTKAVIAVLVMLIPLVIGLVKVYIDFRIEFNDLARQNFYFHGPWPPINPAGPH